MEPPKSYLWVTRHTKLLLLWNKFRYQLYTDTFFIDKTPFQIFNYCFQKKRPRILLPDTTCLWWRTLYLWMKVMRLLQPKMGKKWRKLLIKSLSTGLPWYFGTKVMLSYSETMSFTKVSNHISITHSLNFLKWCINSFYVKNC